MTRKIISKLSLGEISYVTEPAQSPALATILKSGEPISPLAESIVKYIDPEDGAKTFDTFFADSLERRAACERMEKVWPMLGALEESVRSIVADSTLSAETRKNMITESTNNFVDTIQRTIPDVGGELLKIFDATKENDTMGDELKKIAELEAKNAELVAKVAELDIVSKLSADEKDYADKLSGEDRSAFLAKSADERNTIVSLAKSADEVVVIEGQEIRKSVAGAAMFAVMKAQAKRIADTQAEVAKARDETLTAVLAKRAADEFGNLPGEAAAKVAVLKAVDGLSADVKAVLESMLKAGNAALASAFVEFGDERSGEVLKAAKDKLDGEIKKYRAAHPDVTKEQAHDAVLSANPELYQ